MTVLSVGMGNCVLVQFPDGRNLLFDAGSAWRPDVGVQTIVPALWSVGVRRLDLVILSHGDADHYNGFAELARRIRVGCMAVPAHFDRREGAAELLREMAEGGMKIIRIGAGDRVAGFPGAEIGVLWPPRRPGLARKLSSNELSALVRIRGEDGGKILLTGDFGKLAAGLLLDNEPDLAADILQVPHHGLRDPYAPQLAATIAARVALIPGGRYAESPSPYATPGATLLDTDSCGMITVELVPGQPPRIWTFLKQE